jgi:hypothetical protein
LPLPATRIRLSEYVSINQPEVMIGNAAEPFDTEGNLMDATTKKLIRQLLQSLVQWTGGSRNLTSDRNRCTNGCKQNV